MPEQNKTNKEVKLYQIENQNKENVSQAIDNQNKSVNFEYFITSDHPTLLLFMTKIDKPIPALPAGLEFN
jgi:2,3-bisphosphoglycerate-independent phosphoglycerate mutase